MESPPPAPSAAPAAAATSPRPPIAPSKLRLMCSYGGHIVPRPHDKCLFYASGETRIVALDRRTTASSLSALTAHLSRVLFHNRPFLLKYQLPSEDLDSLISVVTDEDLSIMLEEHDRIAPPARIRIFLFPVKPESLGSTLVDPKSDTWFSDALKNTRILQKGQSADSGFLMGLGSDLEAPVECRSNSGGGGGKLGAESLILETSSSFGSTNSSFSMSNSPAIGVAHCDEKGLNLLDRKVRVPSSASLESENSVGSAAAPPKTESFLEPLIQVDPEESSENTVSDPLLSNLTQKSVHVVGYPFSQPLDTVKQQYETQIIQGGMHYVPQYTGSVPASPYYPLYQLPMPTPQHIPSPQNQPYPIYIVPMQTPQYHNMSMQCSFDPSATSSSGQQPVHPQAAAIPHSIAHKDIHGTQIPESVTQVYCNIPTAVQPISVPSNQGELAMKLPEPQMPSEPVANSSAIPSSHGCEFDEDIAYNQIYKTQPLPPVLPSQYQTMTKGTTVVSEPSVHLPANPL
ncbi:uncharacterized protein LOC127248553 [Andrographis paniculata]|uniref:uncharacterized protein LOC127248553 n=1 Tax=Andrographis paniculata TaxID=175694 RepID=UPI0021E97CBC|nr:uncharacterized protein LOC127248553 [Andrographis paniculata]